MSRNLVVWIVGIHCVLIVQAWGAENAPTAVAKETSATKKLVVPSPPTPGIITENQVVDFAGTIVEVNQFRGHVKIQLHENAKPPVGTVLRSYHKSFWGGDSVGQLEIVRYEDELAVATAHHRDRLKVACGHNVYGSYEQVVATPTPLVAKTKATKPTTVASQPIRSATTAPTDRPEGSEVATAANLEPAESVALPARSTVAKPQRLIAPPAPNTFANPAVIKAATVPRSDLVSDSGEPRTSAVELTSTKLPESKPAEKKRVRFTIGDLEANPASTRTTIPVDPDFVPPPSPVVDQAVLRSYR